MTAHQRKIGCPGTGGRDVPAGRDRLSAGAAPNTTKESMDA